MADGGGREVPLCKRSRNSSVHGLAGINQPRDTSVLVKTWKVLNFLTLKYSYFSLDEREDLN